MTPARAQFRESLDALRVDVDTLGLLAEQAVVRALGSLLGHDRSLDHHVIAGDDRIDALFVALEERAYALVAQQGAGSGGPSLLDVGASGHGRYEKTGDRAVAVARSTLADWDREPTTVALLERIADHAVIIGERVSYMLTGDPSALAAEIR